MPITTDRRHALLTGLLLGLLGFLGNQLDLELFFGIKLFFGSTVIILALVYFGTTAGLVAAALAGSATWLTLHHPWAALLLFGEAVFLAYGLRRSGNIVLIDTLYWLTAGIPATFLYQWLLVRNITDIATMLALKNAINGVFNAVVTAILIEVIRLRTPFRGVRDKLPTMQQLLFTAIVAAVLIPGISYVLVELKNDIESQEQQAIVRLSGTSRLTKELIENWFEDNLHDVKTLAVLVGDPQSTPAAGVQQTAELVKQTAHHLITMSVQNDKAISVAFVPATDPQGNSNIGRDYSRFPYYHRVRDTLRPVVSDVDFGTVSRGPRIALFAPIIREGRFRGYCTGVIDLTKLQQQLQIISQHSGVEVTLLDRRQQVIGSTDPTLHTMARFSPREAGTLRWLSPQVYQYSPRRLPGMTDLLHWQRVSFRTDTRISDDIPWTIVVSQPIMPYLQHFYAETRSSFSLLLALIAFTLAASQLASNAMTRPIARLERTTAGLPAQLIDRHGNELLWPPTRIREVAGLIDNYQAMASVLRTYVGELQSLNASLERRVAERTQELQLLNEQLEQRVHDRTAELQAALRHMESFSYSISHDLRSPLRAVDGYVHILLEDFARDLSMDARQYLHKMSGNVRQMGDLIDDLLTYSRLNRQPVNRQTIDLAAMARELLAELEHEQPRADLEVIFGDLPPCTADPTLLRQVLLNLLSNALKFTRYRSPARIELSSRSVDGIPAYFIRDNGVGFDMAYVGKLFGVFQRLHANEEFEGTGVGLAIVQNVITRHGGTVWAEGAIDQGATFFFTLPQT